MPEGTLRSSVDGGPLRVHFLLGLGKYASGAMKARIKRTVSLLQCAARYWSSDNASSTTVRAGRKAFPRWRGRTAGQRLLDEMENYNHQVGLKIVGECLPQERNRVTLTDLKDQYGLPVPRVTYSFCDNDRRLIQHSLQFMRTALEAAGARDVWDETDDTCHLNGTARMGDDPSNSVVDADCRCWDIRNLWICDGSVFPTVGGVNPSLTIQAIACRTADRIRALAARGEL